MNATMATTIAILLSSQLHPSGLELRLQFDRDVIPLGDVAYCELQIWNRSDSAVEFPKMPRLAPLLTNIKLPDGKFINTQDNDVGVNGTTPEEIAPGKCLSAPAYVILWKHTVLKTFHTESGKIAGNVTLGGPRGALVLPMKFSLQVRGRVASNEFLADTLYQDAEKRRKLLRHAETFEQFRESPDYVVVQHMLQDDLLRIRGIDAVIKELRPNTAVWRRAQVARLVLEYEKKKLPFDKFADRLVKILAWGGPSERRCVLIETASGLSHRRDPNDGGRVLKLIDRFTDVAVGRPLTEMNNEPVCKLENNHDLVFLPFAH